jgi:hypothetical protein
MPRPAPLKLISIPQIGQQQVLPQKHDYAGLLGHPRLPDHIARELAHNIALARVTPALVVGLTLRREAAELKRCAKKLRHGRDMEVRQKLANPAFGFSTETLLHLQPLIAAPSAELLAGVEACQREAERKVKRRPQADPQRQALESAGGAATVFFLAFAEDSVRDEPAIWWRFVLAFLDDAEFPTEMLYQHPESLRPLLALLKSQLEEEYARAHAPGTERPR